MFSERLNRDQRPGKVRHLWYTLDLVYDVKHAPSCYLLSALDEGDSHEHTNVLVIVSRILILIITHKNINA